MRTYAAAFAAARARRAFSNGTEFYAWTGQWCDRCIHDVDGYGDGPGCPLLLVALLDRTPAEWLEQDTSHGHPLGDTYHCVEFRDQDDPGPGYEPAPDPPLPGQGALFPAEPYAGVRMYADMVARPVAVPA